MGTIQLFDRLAGMMTDRSRRSVTLADGERMSYFEAGEGPDLLLIHGAFVTSHDMLASLFEPLAKRFHVVAVDRPGHGLSTRARLTAAPRRQAAQILRTSKTLGLRRPLVVGHSLGATIAVELALGWPDAIASVVAIAPMAFPEARMEQFLFGARATPGFGDFVAGFGGVGPDAAILRLLWRAMFLPQQMPDAFRDGMAFDEVRSGPGLLSNGEDALATAPALAANVSRYVDCDVPIEIIYGDRDIVISPRLHSKPLARLLGRATLTRAEGRGHMLHHFESELIVETAIGASALDWRAPALSKTPHGFADRGSGDDVVEGA